MSERCSEIHRKTGETDVLVSIDLDGTGKSEIDTGVGFFDHMLTLFSLHGQFDLCVNCNGDIEIDGHHSVEDIGIAMGQAFCAALGEKRGITRYGSFYLPMDETLVLAALDISGRPFLVYDPGDTPMTPMIGGYDTELTGEFLRAFAFHAGLTLHVKILYGRNSHHKVEAVFKAVAHALRIAAEKDVRLGDMIPSTKGVL